MLLGGPPNDWVNLQDGDLSAVSNSRAPVQITTTFCITHKFTNLCNDSKRIGMPKDVLKVEVHKLFHHKNYESVEAHPKKCKAIRIHSSGVL